MNKGWLIVISVVALSLLIVFSTLHFHFEIQNEKDSFSDDKIIEVKMIIDFNGANPMHKHSMKKVEFDKYGNVISEEKSNNTIWYFNLMCDAGMSVYDALQMCSEMQNFSIGSKYYKNFKSHFITSICGVENSDETGMYWQYYINDIYGDKGVDLKILKDSDEIYWVYEKSPW